jgi:hypothetical protein
MKPTRHLSSLLFLAISALLPATGARAADQTPDPFAMVRASYQADREAKLKEMLQLTETESAAFWPIQRAYRADMEVLGDSMVKLVLEYSDLYPNIPEERAQQMLKDYTDLEEKLVKKRAGYLKKATKALPTAKVLRWAQLENRMDLALRMQIAGTIPLAPGESKP